MREPEDLLLTPAQVAAMFAVRPRTITLWANAGKLQPIKTLGGHRRYKASVVRRLVEEGTEERRW